MAERRLLLGDDKGEMVGSFRGWGEGESLFAWGGWQYSFSQRRGGLHLSIKTPVSRDEKENEGNATTGRDGRTYFEKGEWGGAPCVKSKLTYLLLGGGKVHLKDGNFFKSEGGISRGGEIHGEEYPSKRGLTEGGTVFLYAGGNLSEEGS